MRVSIDANIRPGAFPQANTRTMNIVSSSAVLPSLNNSWTCPLSATDVNTFYCVTCLGTYRTSPCPLGCVDNALPLPSGLVVSSAHAKCSRCEKAADTVLVDETGTLLICATSRVRVQGIITECSTNTSDVAALGSGLWNKRSIASFASSSSSSSSRYIMASKGPAVVCTDNLTQKSSTSAIDSLVVGVSSVGVLVIDTGAVGVMEVCAY